MSNICKIPRVWGSGLWVEGRVKLYPCMHAMLGFFYYVSSSFFLFDKLCFVLIN